MDSLSINAYYLQEVTDFFDYSNLETRPIVSDLKLLDSFDLDSASKLSHNFLVSNNTVETTDARWNLFEFEKDYNYLSFVKEEFTQSSRSSTMAQTQELISFDKQNYIEASSKINYSLNFFLSSEKFIH